MATPTNHPSGSNLTAKQQRFVDEYLIDLNATQAAIRAGYKPDNADVTGPRMLGNVRVAEEIACRQRQRAEKSEMDEAWILEQLRANVERAMQVEAVVDREGNPTGEYTYQGNVANKALELIGKHRGMFVDRSEHKVGGVVEVRVRIAREGRRVTAS